MPPEVFKKLQEGSKRIVKKTVLPDGRAQVILAGNLYIHDH